MSFPTPIVDLYKDFESWVEPYIQHLDPSNFQQIILGILAIFIPFVMTSIQKGSGSKFRQMIFNNEILKAKEVYWFSVTGLAYFAFFSRTDDMLAITKIMSIVVVAFFIWEFWIAFSRVLKFADQDKPEYEKSFLETLRPGKTFQSKNKRKLTKLLGAWGLLWSEKSEDNDFYFTSIFVNHIDSAMRLGEFELTIQLAHSYVNNINKRSRLFVDTKILPAVIDWHQTLWNKGQSRKKDSGKTDHQKESGFWDWSYFGKKFFLEIIEMLIADEQKAYQRFRPFKQHIMGVEQKINASKDDGERDKYRRYIAELFHVFCLGIFGRINAWQSHYDWKQNFPLEWRISMENVKSEIPHMVLREFLHWSNGKVFQAHEGAGDNSNITKAINGIFPNVHPDLFTAFLMLFFSSGPKQAIQKEPNFLISKTVSEGWQDLAESKEAIRKRQAEEDLALDNHLKQETVRLILGFFSRHWDKLTKGDLQEMQREFQGAEIKALCTNDAKKEQYRQDFLELIALLLNKLPE